MCFGVFLLSKEFLNKMFNFLRKKHIPVGLTLETLVEMSLITKEEMLLLKKERATKEWENWVKQKIVKKLKTKL